MTMWTLLIVTYYAAGVGYESVLMLPSQHECAKAMTAMYHQVIRPNHPNSMAQCHDTGLQSTDLSLLKPRPRPASIQN